MLKYTLYVIVLAIVIGACIGGFHLYRVSVRNKKEMSKYEYMTGKINTEKLGKVLVVYYSLSGNTKDIAMRIKNKTNADIFEIKTKEEYKAGPKLYLEAKKQLKEGNFPGLVENLPDIDQYDTIFVGAPVWWYTMAPPAHSFLMKTDFMGKKVVPFSTQGSNVGTFFADFRAKAKNAVILQEASFNNMPKKYDKEIDNKVSFWIHNL